MLPQCCAAPVASSNWCSVLSNGIAITLLRFLVIAMSIDGGELVSKVGHLSEQQRVLIGEMVRALQQPVEKTISDTTDILSDAFEENFCNRLLLNHAISTDVLNKKTFEYAFQGASIAAGRNATLTASSVEAGADITVDGIKYSLKTEAAKSIRRDLLHISKLMEARWIRDCQTGEDYCRYVNERLLQHFKHYQRVLCLRVFRLTHAVEYEIIEIPLSVFMAVEQLLPSNFSARRTSGSSNAVVSINGKPFFTLSLDGSVEKITVRNLRREACIFHGSWKIPTQIEAE